MSSGRDVLLAGNVSMTTTPTFTDELMRGRVPQLCSTPTSLAHLPASTLPPPPHSFSPTPTYLLTCTSLLPPSTRSLFHPFTLSHSGTHAHPYLSPAPLFIPTLAFLLRTSCTPRARSRWTNMETNGRGGQVSGAVPHGV